MKHEYKTHGTCSSKIEFELGDDNRIHGLHFKDGCNGNLKGISALAEGMEAGTVIEMLKGIRCGRKSTSCPDQLTQALEEALMRK